MPNVLLMRHAHAEWPAFPGCDFDRPLTPRGEADAMRSAAAIRAAGLKPVRLLVSPALRTRQTAQIVARELGINDAALQFIETLYNAGTTTLEVELRCAVAEAAGLVMLVSHNPGISELARCLAGEARATPFAPADWRLLALDGVDAS